MGKTHENRVRSAVLAVVSLIVFRAEGAAGADRQAQARAATEAARSLATATNPYGADTAAGRLFEAQRAATARALGGNATAASGTRSTEVSSGRGAAATTNALTQPVRLPERDSAPAVSTALTGANGQASLVKEIALLGAQNSVSTQDAISISGQNANDVIKAIEQNSNDMILTLTKTIQTQIEAQRKAEIEAARRAEAARAAAPKKKSVRDRLGSVASNAGAMGGDPLNHVPDNVQTETKEILSNLDEASKPFLGRDNLRNR